MNIAIRNIQKYLFNWTLSPETEFMVAFAEEETAILTISRVFFVENAKFFLGLVVSFRKLNLVSNRLTS